MTSSPTPQATAPSRGVPSGRLPRSAPVDFIRLQEAPAAGAQRLAARAVSAFTPRQRRGEAYREGQRPHGRLEVRTWHCS